MRGGCTAKVERKNKVRIHNSVFGCVQLCTDFNVCTVCENISGAYCDGSHGDVLKAVPENIGISTEKL